MGDQSQFIEMFGNGIFPPVPARTIIRNMRNGVSPSTKGVHYEKVLTLSAVTQGDFDPNAWKDGYFDACPGNDKRINSCDFYMCRGNGNKSLVGRGVYSPEIRNDLVFPDTIIAATIDTDKVLLPFLYHAWQQDDVREQIEREARTTNGTYKINQKVISDIKLIVPPLELQHNFVSFLQQIDKSKFSIQIAIYRVVW